MKKTDSYKSCHVCDVWGWGPYILPGFTGTFYLEPNLEPPKNFPAPHPCFQDFHKTGMDARPLAIGCPLVDLMNKERIEEKRKRRRKSKKKKKRKKPKFGLLSKIVEWIGTRL